MTLQLSWLENSPYYDSRVIIYARKMFIRLAAGVETVTALQWNKALWLVVQVVWLFSTNESTFMYGRVTTLC